MRFNFFDLPVVSMEDIYRDMRLRASAMDVAIAVLVDNGKVLLIRRTGEITWHFPGGKVEAGETSIEAATRELAEEANVDADMHCMIGDRIHPVTGVSIQYVGFQNPRKALEDYNDPKIAETKWVDIKEVDQHLVDIFDKVKKYLSEV